ncbi:anti-repressor SinI family protein [Aquibacillus rhizosphaerae]|uniref:Anti-repressor SinI family protein n=1 Tax=Aquibacillus rhizosphaerae TaxID=3051431 RepID=A0ABT7L7G3_9BACI|nr:anti-repressor SinI family protein [Aquibacillus sp. LR5S19]MDL4841808.1 anti-repressor SinI family protein [Aquibacillus sp. LR5S19]
MERTNNTGQYIDKEWILLIALAKHMGMTIEEIRFFLKEMESHM